MKKQIMSATIICILLGVAMGCESSNKEQTNRDAVARAVTEETPVVVADDAEADVEKVHEGEPVAVADEKAAKEDVKEAAAKGDANEVANEAAMEIDEKEAEPVKDLQDKNDAMNVAGVSVSGSKEPTIVESENVMLNSIILARGVDKRDPVEPGTTFAVSEGEKIYAILDVKNETDADITLYVSWKMPGSDKEIGKVDLTARPAKNWRTWSFTRWAKKVGTWEAIVRNENDDIIGRAPFDVTE